MAIWGYLRYTKSLRMRGKYLNAFGEYAERIYAYMEKTPRDIKVCIYPLIIIKILINLRFFLNPNPNLNGTD